MAAPLHQSMFAATFESLSLGYRSNKVPPHVTLLPWADYGLGDANQIGRVIEVSEIIGGTPYCELIAGDHIVVGAPGFEKRARRVLSPDFRRLHSRLYHYFSGVGIVLPNPEWLGDGYDPHCRLKDGNDPFQGTGRRVIKEIVVINNVPRVDDPTQGEKVVSVVFGLGIAA